MISKNNVQRSYAITQDIFGEEAAVRSYEFMLDGLVDFLVDLKDL